MFVVLLQEIVAARPDDKQRLFDIGCRNKVGDLPECVVGLRAAVCKIIVRLVGETQPDRKVLHPQRPIRPTTVVMQKRLGWFAARVGQAVAERVESVV